MFNKPYGVLCQFRPSGARRTLADFIDAPGVYAAGRLDAASEGLLVLTDNGDLQHRITDPRHKLEKVYWVEVEQRPAREALDRLRRGLNFYRVPHLREVSTDGARRAVGYTNSRSRHE